MKPIAVLVCLLTCTQETTSPQATLQNKEALLGEDEPLSYCVTPADSSLRCVGSVVLKISFLGSKWFICWQLRNSACIH